MKTRILAFHVGRGGRFHNQGHLSFIGENTIDKFTENLFLRNRDEKGRFISPEYFTEAGNKVGLTEKECESGIGRINIDNSYDTTYTTSIDNLSENEIEAIQESDYWDKDYLLKQIK